MNTRLQVEHPVTEMITGLDLVELQLLVAAGEPLPRDALEPSRRGHAIEVRLCAEDPANGYLPSTGRFDEVGLADRDGIRVDSGIESGSVVSPFYDSMVAKLIAHAPTRAEAARRLADALRDTRADRPGHQPDQLIGLLERVAAGGDGDDGFDTGWLDRHPCTTDPADPRTRGRGGAGRRRPARRRSRTCCQASRPAGGTTRPAAGAARRRPRRPATAATAPARPSTSPSTATSVVPAYALHRRRDRSVTTVFAANGALRLDVPPRFVRPDEAGRAGSLVAPMPGSVLRVLVERRRRRWSPGRRC